jgi:hypothetical protein
MSDALKCLQDSPWVHSTKATADMYDPSVLLAWQEYDPSLQSELAVTANAIAELRNRLDAALKSLVLTDQVSGVAIAGTVTAKSSK